MGKAIVFKGVSFQANALEQITFVEPVPCTALTLNKNTVSFEYFGDTDTIVATPVPSNTTDQMVWSTSNAEIATVDDGVITLKGLGDATITVTCGNASASINVSQQSAKVPNVCKKADVICAKRSDSVPNMVLYGSNGLDIIGQQYDESDEYVHVEGGDTRGIQAILVPYGANKLGIETNNATNPQIKYSYGDPSVRVEHDGKTWPTYLGDTSKTVASSQPAPTVGNVILIRVYDDASFEAITGVYFSKQ